MLVVACVDMDCDNLWLPSSLAAVSDSNEIETFAVVSDNGMLQAGKQHGGLHAKVAWWPACDMWTVDRAVDQTAFSFMYTSRPQ